MAENSAPFQQLTLERRDGIAVCTITNPPAGYMTSVTVEELDRVTAELEHDESVRVIIFTGGIPGVFIQHYSVEELEKVAHRMQERGTKIDPSRLIPERDIDRLFNRLENMPKPVIAALNGNAMGGGFEMALACDIRLAEDGPYFLGLPEVRVGILPGAGGTQRLTRLLGVARALEMILRGRTVSPQKAAELGMVHEVCNGPVIERALEIAEELAKRSPQAIAHIKRLVRGAPETPLAEGLALERTLFLDLMTSKEAIQLMSQMNRGQIDIRSN
jgi:enoyl-CoA hydratase